LGSTDKNKLENENSGNTDEELTGEPSAQGENDKSGLSNTLIYVIGGALFIVIIGVVLFIVMRKQKQKNPKVAVSANNSIASSNISGADMYEDA
jgi:ABC-type Fe3+ transport system permease subunit